MKRATGRTTRMLLDAVKMARDGINVLVVGASYKHAEQMLNHVMRIWAGSVNYNKQKMEIQFPEGSIIFKTAGDPSFDWLRLRFYGLDNPVLVDHYAIESWFAPIMEMLHRWDGPTSRWNQPRSGLTVVDWQDFQRRDV